MNVCVGVNLFVIHQIFLAWEKLTAKFAPKLTKRFTPTPQMLLEVLFPLETFTANIAIEPELTIVNLLVIGQVIFVQKPLSANFTSPLAIIQSVNLLVQVKSTLVTETLIANSASERILASMNRFVVFEVLFAYEALVAHAARIGAVISMDAHMVHEVLALGKTSATEFADIWAFLV